MYDIGLKILQMRRAMYFFVFTIPCMESIHPPPFYFLTSSLVFQENHLLLLMSASKEETPAWLNDNVDSLAKNVASSPAAQEFAVTTAINSLSTPGGFSKLVSWIHSYCAYGFPLSQCTFLI